MSLRNEQCNKVCRILDEVLANRPTERDTLIVAVRKAFGALESERKWIPCSERLPEDKTAYYLATVANRGLFFTTTVNNNVDCVRWDYDRRKGQDSWHWCTERTVIAWMPLPEPWRGDNE